MGKKISLFMAGLISVTSFPGCASLIHGGRQPLTISSTPTGAQVKIDGEDKGITPATASLARGKEHSLELDLPGYQKYVLTLERRVSGWAWGNVLIGGLIGLAVDVSTGGMYKLTPSDPKVKMPPPNKNNPNDTVYVALIMKPEGEMEKIGQLSKTPEEAESKPAPKAVKKRSREY